MVSFTTITTGLVALFAAAASAAPAQASTEAAAISGDFTHYRPSVGIGACGQLHQDNEMVAALNHVDFDPSTPGGNPNNNPLCGRSIRANYGGKSIVVKVVDRCPECVSGDLDLSNGAFSQLANTDIGRIRGDWNWI